MLNIRIEDTRREAEETILTARKKSEEIVESFEKAGKSAADDYSRSEMEKIKREIERIKEAGGIRAQALREESSRKMTVAAELIKKAVFPG